MRIAAPGKTFERIVIFGKHRKGKDKHLLSKVPTQKLSVIHILRLDSLNTL